MFRLNYEKAVLTCHIMSVLFGQEDLSIVLIGRELQIGPRLINLLEIVVNSFKYIVVSIVWIVMFRTRTIYFYKDICISMCTELEKLSHGKKRQDSYRRMTGDDLTTF